MPIDRDALTPQQRLAISRRALVQQLRGEAPPVAPERARSGAQPPRPRKPSLFDRVAWLPVARSMAERWWRRHPANAVGQLARPVLDRYARENPAKLVAVAAAAGAVIVLVRPWRLLSVGALVAAALKSSDIADMVTTVMRNKDGKA
ncbi:hypothetical protein QTH89_16850 [Variovorax sp. J22G21]|uniref:hypothetical protein n=1 Tax=Variovorax fucosicus TaxID=3053517 RepID=UPI0025785068|nr:MULTISPECIES: hypothetical protein [unclassified Variovorax]MDM0038100.1 hypothetical protein [Variovorax sp. J22R193]MDM0062876.1 hypothetical protein [Variovorax sp. J22G21]